MKSLACWMVLAGAAAAQDDDLFKAVGLGDRVEFTFHGGHTLRGELCKPRGIDPYDLQKSSVVAVNVRLEYLRLDGAVSVEKQTIRSVKRLPALSPSEVNRILSAKAVQMDSLNREERERIEAQTRRFNAEKAAAAKNLDDKIKDISEDKVPSSDEEKSKKALEIYAMFPEDKGWGDKKYEELAKFLIPSGQKKPKYLDVRVPVTTGGGPGNTGAAKNFSPAAEDDSLFYDNYQLWLMGRELAKKQKEPKAEEPKPAPKPEPSPEPKPAPEKPPSGEKGGS